MSGVSFGWWQDVKGDNPSSWIPTFGNYCGPGWSDGHRLAQGEAPAFTVGAIPTFVNGEWNPSSVDTLCMNHDQEYTSASGLPNEFQLQLEADLALLSGIAALEWTSLTFEEAAYSSLMATAFVAKILAVDIPGVIYEGIKMAAEAVWEGIKDIFNPAGQTYTDSYGNSFSCFQDANGNIVLDCGAPLTTADSIHYQYSEQGDFLGLTSGDPGSGSTTDFFALDINTAPLTSQTGGFDPTLAVNGDGNTLVDSATYWLGGIGDVNTATGSQQAANGILSNDWRPGATDLLHFDGWNTDAFSFELDVSLLGTYTNQQATGATQWTPVDPLILDLNGDGVQLTSFAEAPVLFDIDHDGGSRELTGWVSAEDGILVRDLNDNGIVDGIHETFSEYFNGAVGSDGEAGEKPFADGFAALASLDSNHDDQFTSADAAWGSVKVWVDADHDGETDAGELKTLNELGISAIGLAPTAQSGLVNGGNEVLASGSFVQGGVTKEAQAARFIANPVGNTENVGANGTTLSAEDGQSTYVSSVTTGETLDVAALGVANAYGNSGDDMLIRGGRSSVFVPSPWATRYRPSGLSVKFTNLMLGQYTVRSIVMD